MWLIHILIILVSLKQGLSEDRREVVEEDHMHDFLKFRADNVEIGAAAINEQEKDSKYWLDQALERVKARSKLHPNTKPAKNVILFMGDGMGVSTHTAARIYQGQLKGQTGEENSLFFETLPYTGLSKTYCVDAQVADSACTSTAYTNGVKASIGTMGVNAKVKYGDCAASKNVTTHTESILTWALNAKKSTGVVTTARITHASPGGTYAHTASRDWECDTDKPFNIDCQDIASQLIKNSPGNKINVLFGGGLRKFVLPKNGGRRKDEDLLETYTAIRHENKEKFQIVFSKRQLDGVNASNSDFVLGLFADDHMDYELDKLKKEPDQPTLTEMTKKAIEILSKNKNGFYLFVEGGRIDMAHHDSKMKKALTETIEFDNAIKEAFAMTNKEETLIVVTADHSHTFTIAGYPDRGNKILGQSAFGGRDILAADKYPYLTLGYNNGPGFVKPDKDGYRHNIYLDNTDDKDYRVPSGIPLVAETHGGEDVAVFSSGPWAHLLVGNFEQNYIPLVMSYAARIGPGAQVPLVSSAPDMLLRGGSALHTILVTALSMAVCKLIMLK